MKLSKLAPALPLAALLATGHAMAGELVYTPVNPNFGGNPANGSFLLSEAQAQNHFKEPVTQESTFQQFQDTLDRAILSRIATTASGSLFDANGHLKAGSEYDNADFHVSVVDLGGGILQVTTTDKNTGATTVFQISDPNPVKP